MHAACFAILGATNKSFTKHAVGTTPEMHPAEEMPGNANTGNLLLIQGISTIRNIYYPVIAYTKIKGDCFKERIFECVCAHR